MASKIQRTVPEALTMVDPEIQTLGINDHALNFLVTEYDWLRAKEFATLHSTTVSEIVRRALTRDLDEFDDQNNNSLATEAIESLKFDAAKAARLASYRNENS